LAAFCAIGLYGSVEAVYCIGTELMGRYEQARTSVERSESMPSGIIQIVQNVRDYPKVTTCVCIRLLDCEKSSIATKEGGGGVP
jgi:hypothetical protein